MLQNLFSIRQFRLTKWSLSVPSTTRNASYMHLSHDSILELWRTFPNEADIEGSDEPAQTRSLADFLCSRRSYDKQLDL